MTQRTRTIILSSAGVILFGLLALWWYSGFSLDFMRFFAAGVDTYQPDVVFDTADCNAATGWAFDPDYSGAATIHIYRDGPAGSGTFMAATTTSGSRSDIQTYAQANYTGQPDRTNSGWGWTIPASLKDGQAHVLYVYAIDVDSNGAVGTKGNPQANHSNVVPAGSAGWTVVTKTITCAAPPPAPSAKVACSPSTQNTNVSIPVTVTAIGGGSTYQWFAPTGTIGGSSTGSSVTVTYYTVGTKKITVQSPRGDGSGNVDSVACTIVVGGPIAQP